ncbi:MAG TPA: ABC transporter permease subunit, partial [Saprospiraceae bacterium]|nr:ABC transporter permease subunit [Saprospiraceae bacterium]
RQELLHSVDAARRNFDAAADAKVWSRQQERAVSLLMSSAATDAFDVSRESPEVRARYGETINGMSLLLARRLVEAGVPFITVFGAAFPSIFSGSGVMELLFNYPGLGRLLVEAFQGNNYPLLFALLMFSAMFTIAGMLLADALYAWADPRVRYAARER